MLLAVGTSCAFERDDVGLSAEPLWSTTRDGPPQYWPNGEVPTCFWPGTGFTLTSPGYTIRATAAAVALQQYNNIADSSVDFTGLDNCPSSSPIYGGYRVIIDNVSGGGAQTGVGYQGPNSELQTHINLYALHDDWPTAILHEAGHALGFDHELRRAEGMTVYVDPATGCKGGINGVDGDPAVPWPGIRFTEYDPDSIMNGTYCHWSGVLSRLDKLGVAIVYPASFDRQIGIKEGHAISTPSRIIVRSDDSGALASDWIVRGASNEAFALSASGYKSTWVTWSAKTDVFSSETGELTYRLSKLEAGTNLVVGNFYDFREREHQLKQATVVVDDGLHTAILMSAI